MKELLKELLKKIKDTWNKIKAKSKMPKNRPKSGLTPFFRFLILSLAVWLLVGKFVACRSPTAQAEEYTPMVSDILIDNLTYLVTSDSTTYSFTVDVRYSIIDERIYIDNQTVTYNSNLNIDCYFPTNRNSATFITPFLVEDVESYIDIEDINNTLANGLGLIVDCYAFEADTLINLSFEINTISTISITFSTVDGFDSIYLKTVPNSYLFVDSFSLLNYYQRGYDEGYGYGYQRGYDNGFRDGAGQTLADVSPFALLVDSLNRLFNLPLFGDITISTVFKIAFGCILFGLIVKMFLGG